MKTAIKRAAVAQVPTIRIVVADDHPVVRFGVKNMLMNEPGLDVVGEAEDGDVAIQQALELEPDILLLDLQMPRLPGLEAMRAIMTMPHLLLLILLIPALGPAIVKPCVVGTTARASKENVRSIGYSIYYTLVNVGGALGPLLASVIGPKYGEANVFRLASVFVFIMFLFVLFFFKEPTRTAASSGVGLAATMQVRPEFALLRAPAHRCNDPSPDHDRANVAPPRFGDELLQDNVLPKRPECLERRLDALARLGQHDANSLRALMQLHDRRRAVD